MVVYSRKGGRSVTGMGTTGGTIADLPADGVSLVTSSAEIWTLAPPYPGAVKWLVATGASSAARIVELSTLSSGDSVTCGPTATEIAFNSTDIMKVGLIGVSNTRWEVFFASTGALANVNTTGIVFQAS